MLVAVHDIKTAHHVGKFCPCFGENRLKLRYIVDGGAGGSVTSIKEGMDKRRYSLFLCHFQKGEQVIDMAVHTAVGEKSAEVYTSASGTDFFAQIEKNGIAEQIAVFHSHVYTGHILINDASGTDIQVPHFRVSYEPGRKTYLTAGGIQASHLGHGKKSIKRGGVRQAGGISRAGRSKSVTVEDKKQCGFYFGHQLFSFPSAAVAGSFSAPDQRASR